MIYFDTDVVVHFIIIQDAKKHSESIHKKDFQKIEPHTNLKISIL
jgi:hypothetical protein